MPNPQNLKNWEKGQSGNPNGRPKGTENSKTRLARLLSLVQSKKNPVTGVDEEFSLLEQMDMAQIVKALKGDSKAYKEILDRFEGQSKQSIEVESNNNEPLNININVTKDVRDKGKE